MVRNGSLDGITGKLLTNQAIIERFPHQRPRQLPATLNGAGRPSL